MQLPPTPDQPLAADQRSALLDIINELRGLIEASVSLNADRATLDALADQLRTARQRMEPLSNNRGIEPYNANPGDDFNSILPTSPVTGHFNPLAPPVEIVRDGDRMLGRVTLGRAYEGPPQSVHGAVVSAIYDQLLAFANVLSGSAGPTAQLNVSYLRPTPLLQPLEFSAWVEKRDGRKITLLGECHANGELVTRCEALFIHFVGRE